MVLFLGLATAANRDIKLSACDWLSLYFFTRMRTYRQNRVMNLPRRASGVTFKHLSKGAYVLNKRR